MTARLQAMQAAMRLLHTCLANPGFLDNAALAQ